MSKKTLIGILMLVMGIVFALSSNALISSIAPNNPVNFTYNSSSDSGTYLILNVTVIWTDPTNATNVTWYFTSGTNTTLFWNGTINGSRTSTTQGDFTLNVSFGSLAEGSYTIIAEVGNETDTGVTTSFLNSSTTSFTIDRTLPSIITLERPHNRESVSPSEGFVTLEYTFTEPNAGNSTLYIDGVKIKSSSSGTLTPNITSGKTNKFTRRYTADDSSESWIIGITDLAGNSANSSAFTYSVVYSGGEIQTRTFTPSGQPIPTQAEVQQAQAQGRPLSVQPQPTGNVFIGFLMGWWWVILIFIVVGMYIYNKNKS